MKIITLKYNENGNYSSKKNKSKVMKITTYFNSFKQYLTETEKGKRTGDRALFKIIKVCLQFVLVFINFALLFLLGLPLDRICFCFLAFFSCLFPMHKRMSNQTRSHR